MCAPGVERRALLDRVVVALINADDAGATSGDVVQDGFGDFEPNAELLEARRHGPANVVQSPIRDPARLVQLRLGLAKPAEWTAEAGENEVVTGLPRRAAQ